MKNNDGVKIFSGFGVGGFGGCCAGVLITSLEVGAEIGVASFIGIGALAAVGIVGTISGIVFLIIWLTKKFKNFKDKESVIDDIVNLRTYLNSNTKNATNKKFIKIKEKVGKKEISLLFEKELKKNNKINSKFGEIIEKNSKEIKKLEKIVENR